MCLPRDNELVEDRAIGLDPEMAARTHRERKTHALRLMASVCLWGCMLSMLLASQDARAQERLCDAIEQYIIRNDGIALDDSSDDAQRRELYRQSLADLIAAARRIFGPFCPCDELAKRAVAHQQHREKYRSPPPGWEPGDIDYLYSDIQISREELRLMMSLTQLCHRGLANF